VKVQQRTGGAKARGRGRGRAAWAWLALILPSASCVPAISAAAPDFAATALAAPEAQAPLPIPDGSVPAAPTSGFLGLFNPAYAANAAIPVSSGPLPAAGSFLFAGRTPLDRLRAQDCLAQAVYYEARSESEDGQRAVAQVVLNRVRHPSWPNSVCGVVYQGPMRAGGGCQFTFTCDGALARRAFGPDWDRAQRIAAEALAGRSFAPVGMATHYHTSAVFPAWAPRLAKIAVIGAHNFYRLPGLSGAPGAFAASYAGNEPLTRPSFYMAGRVGAAGGVAVAPVAAYVPIETGRAPVAAPVQSDIAQDTRWAAQVPDSTVREEYRQSGQWRTDAPAAVTGAR